MNREGSGGLSDLKTNMQRVNTTVLKMINQKKYPLSSTKYQKYQYTKLHTCPNQSPSHRISVEGSGGGVLDWLNGGGRSMGEHFQLQNTRYLSSPFRASEELEEVSSRLNNFIWERKREIIEKYSSTDRESIENQRKNVGKGKKNKKGAINGLPVVLKNLRLQMAKDNANESDYTQKLIQRSSNAVYAADKKGFIRVPSCNFFEGEQNMLQLMRRYPVSKSNVCKPDFNKQLKREMLLDLRQNLNSDKYCRMRMVHNHKKIITLGLS